MKRMVITLSLLALAAASPVAALTLTYTDSGTWQSQVTSLTNFDSGTQTIGTATPFGSGGVLFTNLQVLGFNDSLASLTRVNASASQSYYQWNTGAILRTDDKNATNNVFARINFTSPVSAFGFNYGVGGCQNYFVGCLPGAAASVTIAAAGLSPININTTQGNTLAFWGVVSDSTTFTTVDIIINDPNRYIVLDNIAQGVYNVAPPPPPPTETAEPGTLIQIAMGIGLLAMARKRYQGQQQAI